MQTLNIKEFRLHNGTVRSGELRHHTHLCSGARLYECNSSTSKKVVHLSFIVIVSLSAQVFFRNLSVMLFSYRKLLKGRPMNATEADAPYRMVFANIKKKIDEAISRLRKMVIPKNQAVCCFAMYSPFLEKVVL